MLVEPQLLDLLSLERSSNKRRSFGSIKVHLLMFHFSHTLLHFSYFFNIYVSYPLETKHVNMYGESCRLLSSLN